MPTGSSALQLQLDAEVTIAAPTAELLFLTEAGKPLAGADRAEFSG